ncbi:MAG: AsmA family protein [Pseudomonadota bacterium]
MKKLFLVLGVLLVLLVGAVVAAPFLVPAETIKSQLTAQVEAATGRQLTVDGELDLSVLPNLAVAMGDVHFANAEGSDVADMVSLRELKVQLKVLPLLTGAVEIDQFVLLEPKIHLEIDQQGKPNWELAGGNEGGTTSGTSDGGEGGGLPITDLKLGDIRIENGSLVFIDHMAGSQEQVDAINMTVALADIKSPLKADGSLDYKGETIELDLDIAAPYDVLQGSGSAFGIGIKSAPLQLGFNGDLSNQGGPSAAGDIDLSIPSVKGLAAWLADPLDLETEALETLTIAGKLNGSAEKISFTDAVITLDAIKGNGEVTTDLAGATPKINGRLDLGMVDLNPYMPASEEGDGNPSESTAETVDAPAPVEGEATTATDWSDDPIELGLGGVDLAFELTLEGLKAADVTLGRTVLALTMTGPKLVADLKDFNLYDGKGQGQLTVDAGDGAPRIEQEFTLTGLEALPFLTDAADFDRLEGKADATFSINTTGGTERQLVQNLNGDGQVTFADGAIVGINIAAMVRNVGSAFLSAEANETRKTDFAELGGTFTIQDGILTNNDLQLQAPGLRINGAGTVDLPSRMIDYRVEPKAAATLEGQTGATDVAGILVPVAVTGPFDDPSFKPDLSGLVDQAIQDPKALKKEVKQQLDAIGGSTKDLNSAKDLKKALKNVGKGDAKDLLNSLTEGDGDAEESPAGSLLRGLLKD